jgi:hypothetical protein
MPLATLLVAALALIAVLAAPAGADVLVSQASDFPGSGFEDSQYDPTVPGFFIQVFDNVKLTATATATGLSWEGGYPTSLDGLNRPSANAITGFMIGIYADNGSGQPGTLIQSENILGNAGETLVGTDNNFASDTHGQFTYDYSTVLPTAFTLTAGTTYWISIAAVLDPAIQTWGWHTSVAGDQQAFSTAINGFVPNDVAFTLTSTSVPEPSSLAMAGVGGLAALAFARRRRRVAIG